jgi:hypothetical protein
MDHQLGDDHLKAIGRVAVNFQHLEFSIEMWIVALIGSDDRIGMMIASQLPFRGICSLAESLYALKVTDVEKVNRFREIIKEAGQLEAQRNTLFHSNWGTNTDTGLVERMKLPKDMTKGFRFVTEHYPVSKINGLADSMKLSAQKFSLLLVEWVTS